LGPGPWRLRVASAAAAAADDDGPLSAWRAAAAAAVYAVAQVLAGGGVGAEAEFDLGRASAPSDTAQEECGGGWSARKCEVQESVSVMEGGLQESVRCSARAL